MITDSINLQRCRQYGERLEAQLAINRRYAAWAWVRGFSVGVLTAIGLVLLAWLSQWI